MFYEEIYPKLILSKAPYFDLAWSTFSVVASIDIIRDILTQNIVAQFYTVKNIC